MINRDRIEFIWECYMPKAGEYPARVIFNDPATIVFWKDGSKTVVKCQEGDTYDRKMGFAMCVAKKFFGNTGKYNDVFRIFVGEEP